MEVEFAINMQGFFEVYIAAAFIFSALWLRFLVDCYAVYQYFLPLILY